MALGESEFCWFEWTVWRNLCYVRGNILTFEARRSAAPPVPKTPTENL